MKKFFQSLLTSAATPLILALLITPFVSTLPRHPLTLDDKSSEAAVLDYAQQKGWQFGTDVVFTYGPLGFLTSRQFFPATALARMAADALLCFAVSAGLCLAAWRLNLWLRVSLLILFVFVCGNIDPRADLLIYIGLLCWGLLCLVESGFRLVWCAASFTTLAVFAMLVKGNFILFAGLSAVAIIGDLILRRHWRTAIGLAIGLVAGLGIGWLLSGQRLAHLPDFLLNEFSIMVTYDQTVGMEGLAVLTRRGLWTLAAALASIALGATTAFAEQNPAVFWRRSILFLWLFATMVMTWKHGFVRTDLYHSGLFFGFVPVMLFAMELVLDPLAVSWGFGQGGSALPLRFCSRALAILCCCISVFTLESFFFSGPASSLAQPFEAFACTLREFSQPNRYQAEVLHAQESVRKEAALPELSGMIGGSTVDVFGQNQAYAILNGLNYQPRPVFQSYLANNARLMGLNEQFYLSDKAPAYVLFNLGPLDRKFPPLEDALLLRDMALNFEYIGKESVFLLLKAKPFVVPELKLMRQGRAKVGEKIRLDDLAGNLWMEIEVKPTVIGRIRQWAFKPSKIRLAVWGDRAPKSGFGFPAPRSMLSAGFLANPLLLHNEDVQAVLTGGKVTRPQGFSIEVPETERMFWQDAVRFRVYAVGGKRSDR